MYRKTALAALIASAFALPAGAQSVNASSNSTPQAAGAGASDINGNTVSGTLGNQGNDRMVGNAGGRFTPSWRRPPQQAQGGADSSTGYTAVGTTAAASGSGAALDGGRPVPHDARWGELRQDRAELRQDNREVRRDYREVAGDRKELHQDYERYSSDKKEYASDMQRKQGDYQQLRKDVQAGNWDAVRQDRQALRRDNGELRQDRQAIGRDQREISSDKRELRQDYRQLQADRSERRQDHRELQNDRRDYRQTAQGGQQAGQHGWGNNEGKHYGWGNGQGAQRGGAPWQSHSFQQGGDRSFGQARANVGNDRGAAYGQNRAMASQSERMAPQFVSNNGSSYGRQGASFGGMRGFGGGQATGRGGFRGRS